MSSRAREDLVGALRTLAFAAGSPLHLTLEGRELRITRVEDNGANGIAVALEEVPRPAPSFGGYAPGPEAEDYTS